MLEITIWDVNHGSAAYIKTPNGRHIAVDLGDNDESDFSPLEELSTNRGVSQLDVLLITHPHRDHIDDIFNVPLLNPKVLWKPGHLTPDEIRNGNRKQDSLIIDSYLELVETYGSPVPAALNMRIPDNFGGVKFEVFRPSVCDTGNLNNHSLVVVLDYLGMKMVIPGDNEAPSWNELLEDSYFVNAVAGTHVFLAAHHGRDAGYSAELFQAMGQPKLVVVSDGRFGDTSATDRYSKQAKGWPVSDAAGRKETRKCLTTRCDGHITIEIGRNPNGNRYLDVSTTKPDVDEIVSQLLGL